MKIAIHNRKGSFSDRWIKYCENNSIPYKIVNCNSSDIIEQLTGCDGLMWHWTHTDYQAQLFARQLILSLEKMGLKVFPSSNTCWHFDDKVGQKYLLEAINAPFIPSHVFYTKISATNWIENATYPIVFKLRGGAGSANVKLINNNFEAKEIINKAFGKGFHLINRNHGLKETINKLRTTPNIKLVVYTLKVLLRYFFPKDNSWKFFPKQKGYIYFQQFIPQNQYDDRIVIIGNKAIAIRRNNRKNDFRASGSGIIKHNPKLFNLESIKTAFDVTSKIGANSLAFDFIYNEKNQPLIVEISYAFAQGAIYDDCPGYWDKDLIWHEDKVDPQRYIIEDFLSEIKAKL